MNNYVLVHYLILYLFNIQSKIIQYEFVVLKK
jgi:hypothetical protein